MKQVNSVNDIQEDKFILKYGQEFCIPCEMTEKNLEALENDFDINFYSCMNTDESIDKGFTSLPAIILMKGTHETILTDTEILMDEDELKVWISNNI